ncbi:MAG: HAD family phosphatase [Spirochaetia bacterium]|jgi:HAD superfamily hydrolase (TIGR01509 family)|nr:HAD family phosphatase [Spirochaetia bacterium]
MIEVEGLAIRAVAFDMDGLMFDSERVAIELWRSAGRAEGWDIPDKLLLGLVGHSSAEGRRLLVGSLGSSFPYDEVRARRLSLEAEYYLENPVPLKPGLIELLDGLARAAVPLAVATSTTRPRVLPLMKKAGILERFDFLICGDEVEKPKPDPEIYLKAITRLGVKPAACLVLEDSLAGVAAAHAAGAPILMVPDVIEPDRKARAMATKIFASLTEVRKYLRI